MSTILSSFKTQKLTVWSQSAYDANDPYSSGFGSPVTFDGRFMNGGQISRDNEGAQFMPAMTIVTKYASVAVGDRIALGAHTDASPVSTAQTVRKVESGTPLMGTTDYKLLT